jgi:N-acetylmuramoyl-L-alanine amidase
VHADSFRDRKVRGTTVYVLSNKGASDEASRRLAERENAADLIGGVSLVDKDKTLASVLLDLSQNASLSASIDVGDEILDELGEFARLRKREVQQAPFLVLKSPDVPSVLIETAFISNPEDERNLTSAAYQQRLAGAILDGVRDYFYTNPPPGTQVAQLASSGQRPIERQYVIRSGDTLSEIASRYNVSLRHIRSANNLRDDRIVVGQVLRIPQSQDI